MATRAPTKRKTRLTAEQRRGKLLDAAAAIIERNRTPAALTMEGLAEKAGVSKALVYLHFPTRDDVLLGILEREVAARDEVLRATMREPANYEERLRQWAKGFFDFVESRGMVLNVLLAPPREPAVERAHRARHDRNVGAWVDAATRTYGADPDVARLTTELISAAAVRAAECWKQLKLPRELVERVFVTTALSTIDALGGGRRKRR